MIPSIFISSTIADLHYLRDALRDSIEDLAYKPIMSDYGEVGYLAPTTAADSCYRTVAQCQLVILIIGKRYGDVDEKGLSVTHKEFLRAKEEGIPIISFIENEVLTFKQVYDTDPSSTLWDKFSKMDNPRATFDLIDRIKASPTFNSCIRFTSAGDAKRLLKLQIADFVGERLNETIRPMKSDVQDVLAEVKAIRQELQSKATSGNVNKYARALRFLLSDKVAGFRKFIELVFFDIDAAMPHLMKAIDLQALLGDAKWKLEINNDMNFPHRVAESKDALMRFNYASMGDDRFYVILKDKSAIMNQTQYDEFNAMLQSLGRITRTDIEG